MAPPPDATRPYKRSDFCDTSVGFVVEGRLHMMMANPADIGNRASAFRECVERYRRTHDMWIEIPDGFNSIYASETQICAALLEAIKKNKFDPEENERVLLPDIISQLIIYNFGRVAGAPRLQEAAASNFKQLLGKFDVDIQYTVDAGDDLVKFIYGGKPRDYANLAPEHDHHGLRAFFVQNQLPQACKYLSRFRTMRLLKKVPEFAVDLALSYKPQFGAGMWLTDDGGTASESEDQDEMEE